MKTIGIPNNDIICSPVILTGRGGSGTRLLSCLIQDIGIFLGNNINETEDSVEWVQSIYNLVINEISISNKRFNLQNISRLRDTASKVLSKKGGDVTRWGLKLPETMLCLPELMKAFPNAKIIHLVRHPVSISLRRSHMTSRLDNQVGQSVLKRAYKDSGLDFNDAKTNSDAINNAVSWNFQLNQVCSFAEKSLNINNYIEIKYEDICQNPNEVRLRINKFLNYSPQEINDVNLKIDKKRMKPFLIKDNELNKVWNLCSQVASRYLGYEKSDVLDKRN